VSTPDTGPSAAKASARADARARRQGGPRPDPKALAERALGMLDALPGPRRVTCYASYGSEPATDVLCARLASAGFEVLLPRVTGDELEWVLADADVQVSAMGIAEPTGAAVDLLPVRALLIPALAVTPHGDRLGKGGGYYDRVLAAAADAPAVIAAIVGDADVIDSIPTEKHDQRVDFIITPTRVIDCTRTQD